MKCPKCHFDNPEESSFCSKCGTQIRGHVPDSPESGTCPQNSKDIRSGVTETLKTPIKELTTGSTLPAASRSSRSWEKAGVEAMGIH
jgi:hypothetical protein